MRKLKPQDVPPAPDSVGAVSTKLSTAIEKGDKESRVSAARAAVFESANATKETPMAVPMRRIIEAEFDTDTDLVAEKERLEDVLDSSNRQGHQASALEQAETNARKAFRLLIRFRKMHAEWEMDNSTIFSAMRIEAEKALQREKEQGYRSKQITDKDVEAMISTMFPDEYRAQEVRRLEAKQTEKSLEHLVDMCGSKCKSLNTLVGKGR